MSTKVETFENLSWYIRFLEDEGNNIQIISVNILKDGDIMVTYKDNIYPF